MSTSSASAAEAARTQHADQSGTDPRQALLEFAFRVAERFGLPVVILVMVLWWARSDIVQPLLDAHFQLIRRMTEAQDAQVRHLENMSQKLDRLINIQAGPPTER
jgi:hypothetical protein